MKSLHKALSFLLISGFVLTMSACTPDVPGETDTLTDSMPQQVDSEGSTESEEDVRDIYEDLSFQVPAYTDPKTRSRTLKSKGSENCSTVKLDFTALNGAYIISPTKIQFNCHDISACNTCGYVATDDGGAYLMSSEGLDQGGITVTLATPILASIVQGMSLTFKTTAEAPSSSMRILSKDETNNSIYANTCPAMDGATREWKTIDLGVKNFADLADSDGLIRSFQMYFRNKNDTDCYVQNITFSISPENLLPVDEVTGNCFYNQGAVDAVAEVIATRFTAANIRAEIAVNSTGYKKNSSESDGFLEYKVTVTLSDGTVLKQQHKAKIPAISGAWLDTTDGKYGSSHDSLGQWQTAFDPAGILFLTDNQLACAEGIDCVQYAVVSRDTPYDSADIRWHAPQRLTMNDDGFSQMLVNAFLDYGNGLTEQENYRFLVRGVSKRENYILHLDIPFVYSPLSKKANAALSAAITALENTQMICSESVADKEGFIKDQMASLINDEHIAADVAVLGEGAHSIRLQVSLRYTDAIKEPRLPVYTLDGQVLTDVYNYGGIAFFCEGLTVPYDDQQASIDLLSPFDGKSDVILAADCIYTHAHAPLASIQNPNYGYICGEYCTPPPVRLVWSDRNGSANKSYTVLISANRDMSDARVFAATGTSLDVYNLNIGTQYYWQVQTEDATSFVHTFTTEDGYPRFIKLDGVSNVRDMGGYVTVDGKRVRQNLAYRSGELDKITAEGLQVALNDLNIRTDLDLRNGSTKPLGNTVQHIPVPMQWYEHIFEEEMLEHVRKTMSAFAYEENYPILFHCSLGRDRTGTTAFLLLGLLGVDEDTLRHEYFASFFSQQGGFNEETFSMLIINMSRLTNGLSKYADKDATLQEKIEAYLLYIGVTDAEIQSIRNIWLEP